jgi:uncharacterized membrane protein (UPF0127 family)
VVSRTRRFILSGSLLFLIACSIQEQQETPLPPGPPQLTTSIPPAKPHPVSGRERIRIPVGGESFLMEISDDDQQRTRGLSGRTRLGVDEGMIFVYAKPKILGYWMKDCLIDLEIIYLRSDGMIMSIHRMHKEPPRGDEERLSTYENRLPRYPSRYRVQFALEFTPGTIKRLGLKTGQVITVPKANLLEHVR